MESNEHSREEEGKRELRRRKMIQALTDQTFTKVCVDSGAGKSVCPIDAFRSYDTHKTSKSSRIFMSVLDLLLSTTFLARASNFEGCLMRNGCFQKAEFSILDRTWPPRLPQKSTEFGS